MEALNTAGQDFIDFLSHTARQQAYVRVHYYSEYHELLKTTSVVKSLQQKGGQPQLVLASGEEIPVERLLRVGNTIAPGHQADDFYSCDC